EPCARASSGRARRSQTGCGRCWRRARTEGGDMEKVSQLMDGELGEQESRLEIRHLEQDEALIQAWATYHLIRDVLRDEAGAGAGLAARVCERLQHEPVVVAPRARLTARA